MDQIYNLGARNEADAKRRANGKIQLAPLSNVLNVRKVKSGTQVTIGVAGDVDGGIAFGKFVGGLILADKEEFEAVKAEMEAAQ